MKRDLEASFTGTKGKESDPAHAAATIAAIRRARRMTLTELGRRSGVSASTISRIERQQTSPTFAVLSRIAGGLSVPVSALMSNPLDRFAPGCRAITRAGMGTELQTVHGAYRLLADEIISKGMAPAILRVPNDPIPLGGHPGEEFFIVIKGAIVFHMQHYSPVVMNEGDSVYFNASTPHAVVSFDGYESSILTVVLLGSKDEKETEVLNDRFIPLPTT